MHVIELLQHKLAGLDEGLGTAYERYAVNNLFYQLTKKYNIKTVLEFPANGVLGVPGLNSLIFAKLGCKVTLLNRSKNTLAVFRKLWRAFGFDANYTLSNYEETVLGDNSFDLVYGFCTFEHFFDVRPYLKEMVRLSRKYVLLFVQNNYSPGIYLHRLQHKLRGQKWDHGDIKKMGSRKVLYYLQLYNLEVLEVNGVDMPPWPDINVNLKKSPKCYNPNNLRRQVRNKLVKEKISEISSTHFKNSLIDRLLKKWYDAVESKTPGVFKKYFAHHPYVLAIKNDIKNNQNR